MPPRKFFLRHYKHLGDLDETRGYDPWLYRVTVNVCRDIARGRRRSIGLAEVPDPVVLRVALRLLNNPQDAQDAAQEVFLRLYKHLGDLDETRGYEPWLYRVTVNVCRDIARGRRRSIGLAEDVN